MGVVDSWNSYSDTTTQKTVITNYIDNLDPSDAPGIVRLGGLDGAASKFRFTVWPNTLYYWLEDSLPSLSDTMSTTASATNATILTVSDASKFHEGHIIEVPWGTSTTVITVYYVSAVNKTNNTLTVNTIGGTDTIHTASEAITIVGMARLEGADSDDDSYTSRTSNSNYTQIWHAEIKVSRSQNKLAQWGISSEFDYQAGKAIPGLMRQMERHMLRTNLRSAGSASTPRITGGIKTFVSTNKISGASLTKSAFDSAVKAIYGYGGANGVLQAYMSPTNFAKVTLFYDQSTYFNVTRADTATAVGAPPATLIRTPFGDVEPVLDRWAIDTEIPIIDPSKAGWITFDPFGRQPLSVDGDYQKEEIVGEFGFCLKEEKAHALLTAVS